MKPKKLAALMHAFFNPGIGSALNAIGSSLQVEGAMPEAGSVVSLMNQLGSSAGAADQDNFQTSAAASITLTSLQNLTQRLTNGGAVVVTLDAAYNIVNQLSNPFNGMSFPFQIAATGATTVATPTLTGSSVTLAGTTTVLAAAMRWYQALITQLFTTSGAAVSSGTTFSSIAQIGSTNRYTVTLVGNTLTPTVGQAIFLTVTTGTLPSGWYPIDLVSSATSFVIVAPIAGTAFTATAATVPGTTTVPTSQYQYANDGVTRLPGIYSPLMTITGKVATATAVITV